MKCDPERLFEEVAYVAYHFHWSFDEIADLEHPLRRRFVDEIIAINRRSRERGVIRDPRLADPLGAAER